MIKLRCQDIQRQMILANIQVKCSLVYYCEIKEGCGTENYIHCNRSDRSGIAWLTTGIWKMRGLRSGVGGGRGPLCQVEENTIHIQLKCLEMQRWREQFLEGK